MVMITFPPLVPRIGVLVGFRDLLERIALVYERLELSRLCRLPEENQVFAVWSFGLPS
jgi:hypothetical protein